MKENYEVIGIMSGTSLDGLDIAFCRFETEHGKWKYSLAEAETIAYPPEWLNLLRNLPQADALSVSLVHHAYGKWIGEMCRSFIEKHQLQPGLVASHGHTIFHLPHEGMTLQIGSGAAIAAESGITTVCDFRSLDVALHGQGAPLVPIGDRLLFGEYDACVNIGGFANISAETDGRRLACDICPANILLNGVASLLGQRFDESGNIARQGTPDPLLLHQLNQLPYYSQAAPKSLGREWVEKWIQPLIDQCPLHPTDILSTLTEHIAFQISSALPDRKDSTALFTGGGVHNLFLMERIASLAVCRIVVPDRKTIDFKEALIFALLGVLRIRGENNCLAEVTGADHDNCGGAVYLYSGH